jgi:hypothetical protein
MVVAGILAADMAEATLAAVISALRILAVDTMAARTSPACTDFQDQATPLPGTGLRI